MGSYFGGVGVADMVKKIYKPDPSAAPQDDE